MRTGYSTSSSRAPAWVPSEILNPRTTWEDKAAYDARAAKLAAEFAAHFDKAYGNKGLDEAIARQCPGK